MATVVDRGILSDKRKSRRRRGELRGSVATCEPCAECARSREAWSPKVRNQEQRKYSSLQLCGGNLQVGISMIDIRKRRS